ISPQLRSEDIKGISSVAVFNSNDSSSAQSYVTLTSVLSALSTRLNSADALEIFRTVAGIIRSSQSRSSSERIATLIAVEASLIARMSKHSQLELATLAFAPMVTSHSLRARDSLRKILRYAGHQMRAVDSSKG